MPPPALQVNSKLAPLHSDPHGYLLKGQIILQCLKRADALFFQHMLCIVKGQDWLAEYMPDASLWDGRGVPALSEEVLLPVPRGSLTFSAGMAAKVAATRLQQWAFQEAVLRDIWGTMAEALGGEAALPLLKGAAELLMMPKELLMDDGIRADVASCLSLRTVLQILERFAPDEFAGDVVHPSIIAAVKEEMKGKAAEGKDKKADKKPGAEAAENKPTRQPVRLSCAYHTPEEGRVMEAVTRGEEPGIEYDADSEAELESMSCLTSPVQDNSVRATRFGLLHQLWAAGVPRRRA